MGHKPGRDLQRRGLRNRDHSACARYPRAVGPKRPETCPGARVARLPGLCDELLDHRRRMDHAPRDLLGPALRRRDDDAHQPAAANGHRVSAIPHVHTLRRPCAHRPTPPTRPSCSTVPRRWSSSCCCRPASATRTPRRDSLPRTLRRPQRALRRTCAAHGHRPRSFFMHRRQLSVLSWMCRSSPQRPSWRSPSAGP
jgi:hypothetical protein